MRSIKGSFWGDFPKLLHAGFRFKEYEDTQTSMGGFRVKFKYVRPPARVARGGGGMSAAYYLASARRLWTKPIVENHSYSAPNDDYYDLMSGIRVKFECGE